MSKPANKTLIGLFVLGAIALVVAGVVILGSGRFLRKTQTVVCYFEGSVGGLTIGAPVVFRGVKVGSVTDILLRYDATSGTVQIPVFVEIEPHRIMRVGEKPDFKEILKTLIDRGLRARLEMQSIITGQLQVGADFYPDKPAKFVGADPKYPEIPTIPTPLQELAKKVEQLPIEEIVKKIASALEGIDRVVNSPNITKTVQSVSQAAEEIRGLTYHLNAKIGPVVSSVETTVKEAQRLLRDIDEKATTLASSVDETMKDGRTLVRNIDRQIEPLASSVQKTLVNIEKTSYEAERVLRQAQQTLEAIEGGIGEDSLLLYELNRSIKEIKGAAKAIEELADTLERQPESLLFGKKRRTGR
jgi:paraquat-inducible protein B